MNEVNLARNYEFYNTLISCGQIYKWRNHVLTLLPKVSTFDGVHVDIGCGTGAFSLKAETNRKDYSHFVGIDKSEEMIKFARNCCMNNQKKFQFIRAHAGKLTYPNGNADCVTMLFSLRHMNYELALGEARRILKKNGTLIVADYFENETIISRLFELYFQRISAPIRSICYYKIHTKPTRNLKCAPFLNLKTLFQLLNAVGFDTQIQTKSFLGGFVTLVIVENK